MSVSFGTGLHASTDVRKMHVINVGDLYLRVLSLARSVRIDAPHAYDLGVRIWFDDAPSATGECTIIDGKTTWATEPSQWISTELRSEIDRALTGTVVTRAGREGRTHAILSWIARECAECIGAHAGRLDE